MTIEAVNRLSEEEKNIEIAKLCGYEAPHDGSKCYQLGLSNVFDAKLNFVKGHYWPGLYNPKSRIVEPIPNYCQSLDAMAVAEATLSPEQREEYCGYLCVLNETGNGAQSSRWICASATANQRATAFLAVMLAD